MFGAGQVLAEGRIVARRQIAALTAVELVLGLVGEDAPALDVLQRVDPVGALHVPLRTPLPAVLTDEQSARPDALKLGH